MLILIRGLPGSGKSTLAKQLALQTPCVHLEADQFFVDDQDSYCFDASRLAEAHTWCLKNAEAELKKGHTVVVSNTFVRLWEIKPYLGIAKASRRPLKIIECHHQFDNVHNVPAATIKNMQKKWQVLPPNLRQFLAQANTVFNV